VSGEIENPMENAGARERRPLLVLLHGVNLNLLGERPVEHYGTVTLADLEAMVAFESGALGCECVAFQTNHEGEFVELVHRHRGADAMVVNPGAWTHYSYAIHDALELVHGPVAEVHLSDVEHREAWRRVSVIADVAAVRVSGKGPSGYVEAVRRVVQEALRLKQGHQPGADLGA
jgi:3-dehydroquinate dehydratase II